MLSKDSPKISLQQFQAFSYPACFNGIVRLKFHQDVLPMTIHGIDTDEKFCSNFLAHQSAFNQPEDFYFPVPCLDF